MRRGLLILCCEAHCDSDIHVMIGGADLITGKFVLTTGGVIRFVCVATTGGLAVQSPGAGFSEAQPTKRIAAKMMTTFLNTRQLCEMKMQTQVFPSNYWLLVRPTIH